jgi:hypothetical protein
MAQRTRRHTLSILLAIAYLAGLLANAAFVLVGILFINPSPLPLILAAACCAMIVLPGWKRFNLRCGAALGGLLLGGLAVLLLVVGLGSSTSSSGEDRLVAAAVTYAPLVASLLAVTPAFLLDQLRRRKGDSTKRAT